MNRTNGAAIDSTAHIAQSIGDVLTTPIGSRVMRRDYGSLLPDLLDAPFNDGTRLLAYAAVAMALLRWEPRIRISRVQLYQGERAGQVVLDIEASRVDTREALSLRVPLSLGAAS
jgi:hypothetical protein